MKPLVALISLICVLFTSWCPACAQEIEGITRGEAYAIVKNDILETVEISESKFNEMLCRIFDYPHNPGTYYVRFYYDYDYYPEMTFTGVVDTHGTIISREYLSKAYRDEQDAYREKMAPIIKALQEEELAKGPFSLWSYGDKAAFYAKYEVIPYLGIFTETTELTAEYPGADDLTQEQALKAAKEVLLEQFGVTEKQLSPLELSAQFGASPRWPEEKKWRFRFCRWVPQNENANAMSYFLDYCYVASIDAKTGKCLSAWDFVNHAEYAPPPDAATEEKIRIRRKELSETP